MALTLTLLTSKADCDKVLDELSDLKSDLEYKQISLTRSRENAADRASDIEATLASSEAEVDSLASIIAVLPEGTTKTEMENRKVKAEYKLFTAQQRKLQYGTTAVVLYESQLDEVEQRLSVIDGSMSTITNHKATLPA
ncbi:hypothetical protein QNI19_18950 [Cytophagaceae bacterium DM2B3-1]|uniref:Uncharacterized protein n=1 Tax=Xanthocytophaga flava TaxID=3048013 RepID=A0AAE3QV55_9BACT|nr:hypothetical protein [Xanthocytophaga flavus]MDJ1486007.1 hypothetical protein [Xanthocytophaga flavus]MDJ1495025.1 hypothetical protein [Xanthocytophaga flavus]